MGVGGRGGRTVTFVQVRLQLFPSFDSVITPAKAASLSAQARTEYVPAEGNGYLSEVTEPLVLIARAARELTEITEIVPQPFAAVATWKSVLNGITVPAFADVIVAVKS